jgi:methionyl-tRNA formyltransferase
MKTDIGIDTGDMILQKEIEITGTDTAGTLLQRLSLLGAEAVAGALGLLESGNITYTPQDEKAASYYPLIKKSDAEIDFSLSCSAVRNKIRAFNPAPVCFTRLNGEILKVYSAEIIEEKSINDKRGMVVNSDFKKGLWVTCGKGTLRLSEIQLAGGKVMADTELLKGKKIPAGAALG